MKHRDRMADTDPLTPAEQRIVDGVRHGMSNRTLSERRGTSIDAVRYHLKNLYSKLGLEDRSALRHWRGDAKPSGEETQGMQLGPIGQLAIPVADVDVAKQFYGDTLGLPHLYTYGKLAFYDAGGVRLMLNAAGGHQAGSVIYLRVDDIDRAFDTLAAHGIEFAGAPHMIFRHPDGVEEWMAFFDDPFGNPLAIMCQVATA